MQFYIHPCSFTFTKRYYMTFPTPVQLLQLSYIVAGRLRPISKSSTSLQRNSLQMESQVADSQVVDLQMVGGGG